MNTSKGEAKLVRYNGNGGAVTLPESFRDYPVTVIDCGINGMSWFRKYSDGWVECGGYVAPVSIAAYEQSTVTFDVAFPNAVAFIECQPACSATGGSDSGLYGVRDVTTTGFIFQRASANSYTLGYYWVAKGF